MHISESNIGQIIYDHSALEHPPARMGHSGIGHVVGLEQNVVKETIAKVLWDNGETGGIHFCNISPLTRAAHSIIIRLRGEGE